MAQTTTNYGLLKPESTDSYNHLVYDNPNMDTIDATMKANADASIDTATCIKSGTTHTITRSNTDANVFKFTATGDWNSGDTMIVDGVTVSPYLVTGEALKTGAYLINTEVLASISGTRVTVYSNQSEAGTTYFDDTNVLFTANNVQTAIEDAATATGTEYAAGVNVKTELDAKLYIRGAYTVSLGAAIAAGSNASFASAITPMQDDICIVRTSTAASLHLCQAFIGTNGLWDAVVQNIGSSSIPVGTNVYFTVLNHK